MASRQCSSSCSISVTQCGRNLAKTSISRHNGSARSFSPIANIGLRLRSRHRINAVRLSPFPDRYETMEQAGVDPNETISLNSGESSDPVTR